MPAIGMGLLFGAYTLGFWGWSLIKGYDISVAAIVIPGRWQGGWPPAVMPDTQVLGSGTSGGSSKPSWPVTSGAAQPGSGSVAA